MVLWGHAEIIKDYVGATILEAYKVFHDLGENKTLLRPRSRT